MPKKKNTTTMINPFHIGWLFEVITEAITIKGVIIIMCLPSHDVVAFPAV